MLFLHLLALPFQVSQILRVCHQLIPFLQLQELLLSSLDLDDSLCLDGRAHHARVLSLGNALRIRNRLRLTFRSSSYAASGIVLFDLSMLRIFALPFPINTRKVRRRVLLVILDRRLDGIPVEAGALANVIIVIALLEVFYQHEAIAHDAESFLQVLFRRKAAVYLSQHRGIHLSEHSIGLHQQAEIKLIAAWH